MQAYLLSNLQNHRFFPHSIKLLIVYRKNNTCLVSFYDTLIGITQSNEFHIVLGDFNINAQDHARANALSQIFVGYRQIVQDPTHLAGATLDHVYLKNNFIEQFTLQDLVMCIYFSDHDAIRFVLAPKD